MVLSFHAYGFCCGLPNTRRWTQCGGFGEALRRCGHCGPSLWDRISWQRRRRSRPSYFFAGRHDFNTPAELPRAYSEKLRAPRGKQFAWFEDSAHDIFFDQPQELMEELEKIKAANS
jgi:pimeloyl-ACP methyl ester carboxylesterase